MEPNDQEVNWREVAFLFFFANEMLTEKIREQDKEFARLQAQHKRIQDSKLMIKNNLN